jgi:predicted RNA-binding protein with PUA-like domain
MAVAETQFDPKDPYYDEKSTRENPRWFYVHVGFKEKFPQLIPLKFLQSFGGANGPLEHMQLLRYGRLSVQKVSKAEWEFILGLKDKVPQDPKGVKGK